MSTQQEALIPASLPEEIDSVIRRVSESLNRLRSLVSNVGDVSDRKASDLTPDKPQRQASRTPYLTELTVVREVISSDKGESFQFVRGWTLNLSPAGVGFVTPEAISEGKYLVLIKHPEYQFPRCSFEARVLWTRQYSNSEWEQGALLRPLFDTIPKALLKGL